MEAEVCLYSSLNLWTRQGWVINTKPRQLYTQERHLVHTAQEARWTPGPVWKGAKNLTLTEIWCPNCPAPSEALYWLHYPGPFLS